MYSYIRIS